MSSTVQQLERPLRKELKSLKDAVSSGSTVEPVSYSIAINCSRTWKWHRKLSGAKIHLHDHNSASQTLELILYERVLKIFKFRSLPSNYSQRHQVEVLDIVNLFPREVLNAPPYLPVC